MSISVYKAINEYVLQGFAIYMKYKNMTKADFYWAFLSLAMNNEMYFFGASINSTSFT